MFEKFLKNRLETLLILGNVLLAIAVIGSLAWFSSVALDILNRSLNVTVITSKTQELQFHTDKLKAIEALFNRKDVGFAKLHQE